MIKVKGVNKKYGKKEIIKNISFDVEDRRNCRVYRTKWCRKNNYNKYDNWNNRHYKWKYYNK